MNLGDEVAAGADPLDAFLEWVAVQGIEPYPAQEEAVLELVEGKHVVLATPTGSGKSLVAVAMHALHLAEGERSVYTAPIKALVSEKFFALCDVFGADRVGMLTGDAAINVDAPIVCCTAEVLEKMALRDGADTPFDGVVMDEFHYYGDRDRGRAWQIPLITMDHARFLLMSATLGPTNALEEALTAYTGREVGKVAGMQRPVPLTFEYSERKLLSTLHDLVRGGQAPVYAVHFTQRSASELAQGLLSTDLADQDEKAEIKQAVAGFRFDSPFGKHLRRMVLHGVGLHHAGLLPKYRLLVEKLAQQGRFKVICGTDTLGVGINVPIRTALFTQLCKFDGEKVDILAVRDFQQIAGRAGRKGYDVAGLVVVQAPPWVIENQLVASGAKKKKVKAKPPQRGYKHWDQQTFERLVSSHPERLEPRFRVDHGLVLARLQRAQDRDTDPMAEIDNLIERAHTGARATDKDKATAREQLDELVRAGVVEVVTGESGTRYEVYDDLQEDFGLYHALSLFLLHAVPLLDRDAPDYALDVVSLVEAILEHPRVVLGAQVRREKGDRVAELKAAGVPYEERMEILDEVTWPKPKADWIYGTFETWRQKRPWLVGDPIRPKAVVRELVETQAVFSTWVKTMGIDRSEGVLLRYVSQVYKTLVQGVPREQWTDDVLDVIGFLRAMLARVDDSLVTSWEAMLAPKAEAADVAPRPHDISADPKSFRARIRAELHAVVRALAASDFEEAEASVCPEEPFTADDFEAAIAPFLDEWGPVAFDGRTRQGWHTVITPDAPHRWKVSQRLLPVDPDVDPDDVTWSIDGVVDLSEDTAPSGPIVRVLAIGE